MRFPIVLVLLSLTYVHPATAKALFIGFKSFVIAKKSFIIEWLSNSEDVSDGYYVSPQDQAKQLLQFVQLLLVHETVRGGRTLVYDRIDEVFSNTCLWNVDIASTTAW